MTDIKIKNYLNDLKADIDDEDGLGLLLATLKSVVIVAGQVEHCRKMTILSNIHHASSDSKSSSSPYAYSLFKFSSLDNDIIAQSEGEVKWLIGPIDLSITDAAKKATSLSAVKSSLTKVVGYYNEQVKEVVVELKWRMNSGSPLDSGVLVEDANDWPMLGG